ncbi:MAG: LysR family transcriptional regulator [Thiotrichaceae bacterium]|nr:LysR family transcriptional regulator [Thiotrichaceae bacterium]
MNLNNWILFSQIVDTGGLTKASKRLGIPKSTLSRRLSKLEEDFGRRLLTRHGRNFELTDAGHLFYQEALALAKQVSNAQERLAESMQREEGVIKMAAPKMPGKTFLGIWLAEFINCFPHIHIELNLSDRMTPLFDQGYDLALRVGPMANSSLISRKLAKTQRILVASPEHYIQKYQQPITPKDLLQHRCISFSEQSSGQEVWLINNTEQSQAIYFRPAFRSNDMATILNVTQLGAGIALIPFFVCRDLLEQGKLQKILPEWSGPEAEFYWVYPEKELMPIRVRILLDFLSEKAKMEQERFE